MSATAVILYLYLLEKSSSLCQIEVVGAVETSAVAEEEAIVVTMVGAEVEVVAALVVTVEVVVVELSEAIVEVASAAEKVAMTAPWFLG